MPASITVFIVDGDESVRRAMARMMRADGFQAVCAESVESLLQQDLPASEAVLLVDVKTARQSGTSLHEQLNARALNLPVIYLTDCDTERSRCLAKHLGAAGYFRKPIDDQALVDAIIFAVQNGKALRPEVSFGFH
jgi:FixJ family two-component response regulator